MKMKRSPQGLPPRHGATVRRSVEPAPAGRAPRALTVAAAKLGGVERLLHEGKDGRRVLPQLDSGELYKVREGRHRLNQR